MNFETEYVLGTEMSAAINVSAVPVRTLEGRRV